MKKSVKLLCGLVLVAVLSFVGFSSFTLEPAPVEVAILTPAPVFDCSSCPPGWNLARVRPNDPDRIKRDNNNDGLICYKRVEGEGNTVHPRRTGFNIKDNKICD